MAAINMHQVCGNVTSVYGQIIHPAKIGINYLVTCNEDVYIEWLLYMKS